MNRPTAFALAWLLWPLASLSALMAPEVPLTTAQRSADPATRHYAEGLAALRRGDADAAEAAFKAAFTVNPKMPQPLIGMADAAMIRSKPADAQGWLDQAIALTPDDEAVHRALAIFRYTQNDFLGVEAALKKAIAVDKTSIRARVDLADLYANILNRPSDAITEYRAAIAIDSGHAGAHHGLATALAATGQFTEAEAEYRKSAELAPTVAWPLHSLARLQLSRGQSEAGVASLDAALKLKPDFAPALLDKGDVLLGQGKLDAALALYEQAVESNPGNAAAWFKRGALFQARGKTAEATSDYQKTITLDETFAGAYNNLAWIGVQTGSDLAQAARWADKAVKLAPDNAAFRDTQGWVLRAQRKLAEAETVLEKAATMQPPIADIQFHLGMVYLDQKKPDQARRAFDAALAIDPEHVKAKAALQQLATTAAQ